MDLEALKKRIDTLQDVCTLVQEELALLSVMCQSIEPPSGESYCSIHHHSVHVNTTEGCAALALDGIQDLSGNQELVVKSETDFVSDSVSQIHRPVQKQKQKQKRKAKATVIDSMAMMTTISL